MEEQKQEEKKEEEAKLEINVMEEAKKVTEEMKRQNEIKAKLIEREEKVVARQETLRALGGGSQTGQQPEKISEEEAKKKGAMEFWKGTQIEQAIEKHG